MVTTPDGTRRRRTGALGSGARNLVRLVHGSGARRISPSRRCSTRPGC